MLLPESSVFTMVRMPMPAFACAVLLLLLARPASLLRAQTAEKATAPSDSTGQSAVPSALLGPALDTLRQTLSGLRVDKWKGPAPLRSESDANVTSIRHDLEATLPSLLVVGDAASASLVAMLPLTQNVDALYDVVLRVAERAKGSAPDAQAAALEQARASLEKSRRSLGDLLRTDALAQDQREKDLQEALAARPAPAVVAVAPAPVCPAPAPVKKIKPKSRPGASAK